MKAVDRVGAETTWSDTFRVDTRPPDLIVEAPSNGQVRPPYVGVTASIVVRPTILVAEPMVAHGTAVDAGAAAVKVDASMDGTPTPVAGTDEWPDGPGGPPIGLPYPARRSHGRRWPQGDKDVPSVGESGAGEPPVGEGHHPPHDGGPSERRRGPPNAGWPRPRSPSKRL